MSTNLNRLTLSSLLVATTFLTVCRAQEEPASPTDAFAAQVASDIRYDAAKDGATTSRPVGRDASEKKIHWLFAVDASGSMSGGEDLAVKKMLEAFLTHTVVEGDRVTRFRFDYKLHPEENFDGRELEAAKDLEPDLDPKHKGTALTAARNRCKEFVLDHSQPETARVAILLSDHGMNEGNKSLEVGAAADFSRIYEVGLKDPLHAFFWIGDSNNADRLDTESVRRVPVLIRRLPRPTPRTPAQKAFEIFPNILALITMISVCLCAWLRSAVIIRATGKSAELKVPWYGASVNVPVNSGGSSFHLTRASSSSVPDGTAVMSCCISEPLQLLRKPVVKFVGLADPGAGGKFELNDGNGYDYRKSIAAARVRLSVKNSVGVVVTDEPLEVEDSKLRFLLLWVVSLAVIWLGFYLLKDSLAPIPHPPKEPKPYFLPLTEYEGLR